MNDYSGRFRYSEFVSGNIFLFWTSAVSRNTHPGHYLLLFLNVLFRIANWRFCRIIEICSQFFFSRLHSKSAQSSSVFSNKVFLNTSMNFEHFVSALLLRTSERYQWYNNSDLQNDIIFVINNELANVLTLKCGCYYATQK